MSSVLHRDLRATLPTAVRGQDAYLYDAAGKAYLDASGGAAVSCLGHNHPAVVAAMHKQIERLAFAHTSFFTNEPSERLADKLIELAPPGFGRGRVAFVGSGSEAVEAAIKLARQYHTERGEPSRTQLIARRSSYHGNTLGALAASGHAERRSIYEPMLMSASFVSPCFAYRYRAPGESDDAYGDRLAEELARRIESIGPERVAAFIAEPIVGATLGSVESVAGYFRKIRSVCDRFGVLLIADEVMCGMGRSGAWFASAQEEIRPDLITIAKGLGAGYQPIGAVMASERVISAIADGSGRLAHGHTYMSHPIACAAALAVVETMQEGDLVASVQVQGAALKQRLDAAFGQYNHVGDIRGRGLLWSIELVRDRDSKAPFDRKQNLAGRIKATAQELGLICYPGNGTADGRNGDHVLLAPPFTIGEAQQDEIVDKLSRALQRELARTEEARV